MLRLLNVYEDDLILTTQNLYVKVVFAAFLAAIFLLMFHARRGFK